MVIKYLNNLSHFTDNIKYKGVKMLREKVERVLDKVRVSLKAEGGDIELIDVRNDIVYVKLKGACGTCPMSTLTMKSLVETSIKNEVPEIKAVQAV
jgi:Fe-S cluster biogenesis protein NfuA